MERLECLRHLVELSVINNAVSLGDKLQSSPLECFFRFTHSFQISFSAIFTRHVLSQVTRRLLHRPLLVYRMPNLLCIDGIPVSNDEKTKAELYFIEQQVCYQSRSLYNVSRNFLL